MNDYMALDGECEKRISVFMKKNAQEKKPFYIAYWPQLLSFTGFPEKITVSGALLQEGLARFDIYIGKLMKELKTLGIEDNMLVIIMADNGPMTHDGPLGMVETLYRGGKGDLLEGCIRVPAFARWPGVIKDGQLVGDIIHETDLYIRVQRKGNLLRYVIQYPGEKICFFFCHHLNLQ
jgi:arylsulfatase